VQEAHRSYTISVLIDSDAVLSPCDPPPRRWSGSAGRLGEQYNSHMAIFVFGSNLAGRHGKGAALCARQKHGAIYGQGVGLQGNSYAIPTKDERLGVLPLSRIRVFVDDFIGFANSRPDLLFQVTAIGCGLAGYKPADIAPMFAGAPGNCLLPEEFKALVA